MAPTQQTTPEKKDLYFFGYAQDYLSAITDYQRVSGKPDLLPRWALGNWWSRYWAYSDNDLLALMDEFSQRHIPLSVCIVDMDWHITKTGNASSGWTGYSWNRELFPEPTRLIEELHQRGLKTALNLHPAEGIHPHEEAYPTMAAELGQDPSAGSPIDFDIANPAFTHAYFKNLHHPLENQGQLISGGWTGSRAHNPAQPVWTPCSGSITSTTTILAARHKTAPLFSPAGWAWWASLPNWFLRRHDRLMGKPGFPT